VEPDTASATVRGRFLPLERLEIRVRAPLEVVARRMAALVHAAEPSGFGLTHALLGEFDGRRFRMRRGIGAANAWRPVIEGELRAADEATLLDARLRLSWPIALLMVAFFALLALALAALIPSAPSQSWLVALFMALSYAAMMAGFKYESARSRRLLLEILSGQ
jgi:hypothetical protein